MFQNSRSIIYWSIKVWWPYIVSKAQLYLAWHLINDSVLGQRSQNQRGSIAQSSIVWFQNPYVIYHPAFVKVILFPVLIQTYLLHLQVFPAPDTPSIIPTFHNSSWERLWNTVLVTIRGFWLKEKERLRSANSGPENKETQLNDDTACNLRERVCLESAVGERLILQCDASEDVAKLS